MAIKSFYYSQLADLRIEGGWAACELFYSSGYKK